MLSSEMVRFLLEEAMGEPEDGGLDIVMVPIDEFINRFPFVREFLPEPNCDNPDCEACMMLRQLRGESLGGIRPMGEPPIIL